VNKDLALPLALSRLALQTRRTEPESVGGTTCAQSISMPVWGDGASAFA